MSQEIVSVSHVPRVYDFVYPLEPSDKEKTIKLHAVRDASPAMQVLTKIMPPGSEYAGPIFNRYPGPRPKRRRNQRPRIVSVDYSFLRSKDLLLQACRPPIDDDRSGCKKYVPRSYTNLEQNLFDAVKPRFFEYCSRDSVCLASPFQPLLGPNHADRCEMSFYQTGDCAPYLALNAIDGHGGRKARVGARTALFFLRLEEAWPGGPGYACFFGMDGVAGYIWAFRLANDFRFLLAKPCFAMAELEVRSVPEYSLTMDWCLDWKIELLFVHELGNPGALQMKNA